MQSAFPSHSKPCKMREIMSGNARNPRSPPSKTHIILFVQLSTEYKGRRNNLGAQKDTGEKFKHHDIATEMRVNAIHTILPMTPVAHGHVLSVRIAEAKGTDIPSSTMTSSSLSFYVASAAHACASTCSHPQRKRYRTCLRIENCCKCKRTRNTHVTECQTPPPYVPYDAPLRRACKQLFNTCSLEDMCIALLWALRQIISTNKNDATTMYVVSQSNSCARKGLSAPRKTRAPDTTKKKLLSASTKGLPSCPRERVPR